MNFTGTTDDPDFVKQRLENFAGAFDDAREKRAAKDAYKAKAKKKATKKDIIKLGREVKDTYIFKKDYIPELNYMKEKLKEIESSIKKPSKSDKKTKGDLNKLFKEVKATKIPKQIFGPELGAMKSKLIALETSLNKPRQKMMAPTDYKRDVSNASSIVKQYVDEFKYILDNVSTKGGAQTKKINKIRSKLYESASPSDIRDANAMVKELKKDYVKEPKPKVVKAKVGSADDLHKKVVKYVKDQIKKGPLETMGIEPEDIGYIADEAISKGLPPRMSVKFIKSILDELY